MGLLWENSAACYSAFASHDVRFDGRVFVGCASTGVYCRPVCRVRIPKPANCRYFPSAAAAEAGGFRPCLKCRPELAPGLAPVDSAARMAGRAARLIADDPGARSIEQVAAALGVTGRQLRRVFQAQYGVPPVRFAQTARLLLAKNLLTETDLPVATVAFASGFGSVRRFNEAFSGHYRLAPGRFRKGKAAAPGAAADPAPKSVTLTLAYRPPYDFAGLLSFLAARTVSGVDQVIGGACQRTVLLARGGVPHAGCLDGLRLAFPTAERMAALRHRTHDILGPLGVTSARSRAISALAQAAAGGEIGLSPAADAEQTVGRIEEIPGIGPWTAQYVAMRALSWPDAFPHSDYGIKLAVQRALKLDGYPALARILELAEAWKPWRAYAAVNLWRSLE